MFITLFPHIKRPCGKKQPPVLKVFEGDSNKEWEKTGGEGRDQTIRAFLNPGLEEAQAGIKIAGRNINNLRYADDTTFIAESEEELKSLLMMPSSPITSWKIDGAPMETVTDFIFLGSKITADGNRSHETKRCLSLEEKLWPN